jgi:hypothetical protein
MKIKLSELRQIVKSVINENNGIDTKTYSTPLKLFFTSDSAGKIPYKTNTFNVFGSYNVTKEFFDVAHDWVWITAESYPSDDITTFIFDCSRQRFTNGKDTVYNQKYAADLTRRWCNISQQISDQIRNTPDVDHLINKQVRLYTDEANTQEALIITIAKVENKGQYIEITDAIKGRFLIKCADNFINMPTGGVKLYNKKYIADLKKAFCTTSTGGKSVTNIGTYSQTNQNTPVNVAESKLRKIVKSIIKERDCGCSK